MKREFKVRVWNHKTNSWLTDDVTSTHMWSDYALNIFSGEVMELATNDGVNYYRIVDEQPSFEIVQYTGIKDRNGKEIYEGDIVNIIAENKCYPVNFGDCFATADDNCCGTKCFGYHIDGEILGSAERNWGEGALISENMEVVGNIFENPELLKA